MDDLYRYALNGDVAATDELDLALERDAALQEVFQRILAKTTAFYVPQLAAAGSGRVERRTGRNCQIRLTSSRAEPSQVYVIIQLDDFEGTSPNRLYIYKAKKLCKKYPLPPAIDGVIQLLEEEGCDLLKYLRDVDTEVYLR